MPGQTLYFVFLLSIPLFCIVHAAPAFSDLLEKYDVMEQPPLFEGDIAGIFPLGMKSVEEQDLFLDTLIRNGVLGSRRWPGNKMPYQISDSFTAPERNLILRAVAEINANATNFKITPRNGEVNYVFVSRGAPGTGCYAHIGRIGGRQQINLEARASTGGAHCLFHGIIVHELIHAVGFYHEHARTDRDNYVEINLPNVAPSHQHNFRKYDATAVTDLGQPYDYDSIMHYARNEFAIDRTVWTIRPKTPNQNVPIGQRRGLNAKDIAKLNAMYGS